MASNNENREYVSQFKPSVSSSQASRAKTESGGDSEELARNSPQRKAGDPNTNERISKKDDKGEGDSRNSGPMGKFKVPIVVCGVVVVIIGAILALAGQDRKRDRE